ncbi:amidohydrolase [Congregibacter sp.]|uniref:amidohydrolase n=1 Tax=Congregibacter sp. TaxID=2744308 RepID=UPI003F6D54F0
MRDLRVTLVQQSLVWEDPTANREHLAAVLDAEQPKTDLILLPEMFTSGFSMNAQGNAEPAGGVTQDWLQALAQHYDCAIAGSVAIEQGGSVYNRLLFVTPERVDSYDKRHLFRMAGEHNHYAAGRQRVVLEWRDWRIKPEVCYDLRFPVFSRNRDDYDLLFYVANWPSPRSHHWRALLQARAIENLACVIGVNRVGTDGNGLDYSGDSLAFDQHGTVLADLQSRAAVETVCFSGAELRDYRDKFPTPLDADRFVLDL